MIIVDMQNFQGSMVCSAKKKKADGCHGKSGDTVSLINIHY
jgi:hypothetical protein